MTNFPAICLKIGIDFKFIYPSEIIYIHSDGSYSELTISDGKKRIVSKKLKEIEAQLPVDIFVRVHQSYVVNLMYLRSFGKDNKSELHLTNGDVIKISRRKKAVFMKRFIML